MRRLLNHHLIKLKTYLSEINKVVKNKNRVLITTLTKKMAENLTDYLARFQY